MSDEPRSQTLKAATRVAVDWFVRRDEAPLTAAEQSAFERWLDADPVHREVYEGVARTWSEYGELATETAPDRIALAATAATARSPGGMVIGWSGGRWISRRLVPSALAACILGFAIVGIDLPMRLQADATSEVGETKSKTLPDGSTAVLNTGSAIAIDYRPGERRIRLLRGESQFEVVKDPSRPFRVVAGDGVSTALGTVFAVRRRGDGASVTVLEGRVAVTYDVERRPAQEAVLTGNQRISYTAVRGLGSVVSTVDPTVATAWRRGKIIFEDRPLGEVVDELNRYHPGVIRIFDDALRRKKVNGVFETADPVAAVTSLEEALTLKSTRVSSYLILLHE